MSPNLARVMAPRAPKMTLAEAVDAGISELRRDPWEPSSRLVLNLVPSNPPGKYYHGPWGRIVSDATERGILAEPPHVPMWNLDWNEKVWERWKRTDSSRGTR